MSKKGGILHKMARLYNMHDGCSCDNTDKPLNIHYSGLRVTLISLFPNINHCLG